MNSVLDSALGQSDALESQPGWWPRLKHSLSWMGWTDDPWQSGRRRLMQIDTWRVAGTLVAALAITTAGSLAWTWHAQQALAQASAALAIRVFDDRLDLVAQGLRHLAAQPALQPAAMVCSPALVQALLQESLDSALVRRFDAADADGSQRCGPLGAQTGPAQTSPSRPGLSLKLGQQIAAKPVLQLTLPNGHAVQALLLPQTLHLPESVVPARSRSTDLSVVAHGADGGRLHLWGPRRPSSTGLQPGPARIDSNRHGVSVSADLGPQAFIDEASYRAAGAGAGALCMVLLAAAWTWRLAIRQSRLVHRLSHALRKRQFEPFVQPIVDLQTGRCVGGEVLMRWNHPQRGILGPNEFIDEAERTGLILGMSDLTMSLAAHRLAPLALAEPGFYFSFNVTPGQLRELNFAQRLAEIFRADTVPRQQVLLELTERDLVDTRAKAMLVALRADGWRIAIDDFGTGQSSLATIESLPIDRIKIDRAFVSSIDEKTVSRPVLDAIISLARELRISLIAEGVETRSQWDYLAARGVACAQGYLMARPMPISDYLGWLQAQRITHADATLAAADTTAGTAPPAPRVSGPTPMALTAQQHQLWGRMAAAGGLRIEDRAHQLRAYANCFVGRQAVDWMVASLGISRLQALHLGRSLVAVGVIRHVLDEHDFKDDDLFYRLAPLAPAADPDGLAQGVPDKQLLQQAMNFPWRSHSRGLLRHHQCASGRAVVDWIAQHHAVARPCAVQWATQWMRQGALRHIFDTQPFRDDGTLYRLG